MQFLREYAVSIITVSVLSVIFEIILPPKNYKKYISMVIGLVVMMVIISPIKGVFGDFEEFVISDKNIFDAKVIKTNQNNLVVTEFKKRLTEEIQKSLKEEIGVQCNCTLEIKVSENGEIEGISAIYLMPYTAELADFVSGKFGIERERIGKMPNG